MTTNGGRIILAQADTASPPNYTTWTSWGSNLPTSSSGDYGYKLAGLALYDVDGDGYDEIFAVGAIFTDPDPNSTIGPDDNASRLLFWDSNGSANVIQGQPQLVDFLEPGCMGLWVGPRLGECPGLGNIDLIVGKSQTFEVREVSMNGSDVDLDTIRFESAGLGAVPGAFNSIEVMRVKQGLQFYHGIWIGSTAYVYGFKTPVFACGLH